MFFCPFWDYSWNRFHDLIITNAMIFVKGFFKISISFYFLLSLFTTILIFFFYFSTIKQNNSGRIQSGKLIFYLFLALIQYI